MRYPVVVEHLDACGQIGASPVRASVVTAVASILLARGADELIVPVPGEYERERVEEGLAALPPERRSLVKTVDADGEILRRVRDYLQPLRAQAKKWPEDAFVWFAETFCYRCAVGARYRAGVLGEADDVRAFLTLIDVASFHGEARFRLAELAALICAYEPAALDHVAYSVDAPREDMSRSIWELLTTAEYRSVVASSGKIGYVRRPMLAIAELTRRARALANGDRAKAFLAIAKTSADVAGVSSWSDRAQALVRGIADVVVPGEYRPPMISLGRRTAGYMQSLFEKRFPMRVLRTGLSCTLSRCGPDRRLLYG